jgi:type III restriction enzyme
VLKPGMSHGGVDPDEQKRLMIRRTIKEHLDKELRFKETGRPIKVLSLFFIDSVEHYRQYDDAGNAHKGKYALMFEEEYKKLAKSPAYNTLFAQIDPNQDVEDLHNGYFSIDKKVITPFEENQLKKSSSNEAVETSAYNLIMKQKEMLCIPASNSALSRPSVMKAT